MRFASSISCASNVAAAIDELLGPIDSRVTPGAVDLAMLFATAHFEDELEEVLDRLASAFTGAVLMGCTAEGTIGCDREIEHVPSMSLLVGSMPDVRVYPFHVRQDDLEQAATLFDWERIVGVSPESQPTFVAFADPFRVDTASFIEQLNTVFPKSPVVGGIASGGYEPGQNRLIVNGGIVREGIVGVALSGPFTIDAIVSQGCRPIGKPFVITKGDRNIIHELGGHSALVQLHKVLIGLREEDDRLAQQMPFVGRVIDEHREEFKRGDFLIHNIIGFDRRSGALVIAGPARVGTTVQFHVRDAASADENLRALLAPHAQTEVDGALLFGCNRRGTQMWPKPGHDVGVFREILGDVPVAGFFCLGEFGPVGGSNFVHGFTASIALLRELAPKAPRMPQ